MRRSQKILKVVINQKVKVAAAVATVEVKIEKEIEMNVKMTDQKSKR